ncbi:MAG: metal-sensing transcriptional repressor [Clostridia bacterium]
MHDLDNNKALVNRINRINGHLNAVKTMIEENRECCDILIQISAVKSALNGLSKVILKDHLSHCIVEAIECGDNGKIEELTSTIDKIL